MKRTIWLLACLAVIAISCGKGSEPSSGRGDAPALDPAARQAEWKWLQETKAALDLQREQLAALQDQAALGGDVGAKLEPLLRELGTQGDAFGRRLAAYINEDPPLAGQPMKPEQLAAIRLKSADDIEVAREHIGQTGDYVKAIAILEKASALDAENTDLQSALGDARASRYMSAERFATVTKGMGAADVTRLLGRPSLNHVRKFPDRKAILWYYPKNDAGEAAGVYFDEKGIVSALDFEAVKRSGGAPPATPAV